MIDHVFQEFDLLRHQPILGKKPSSTLTHAYYPWAHEPCLFGWRQGHEPPHYVENGMTSVWEVDWEGKQRVVGNEHPTQKLLRLFEIPMGQHTRRWRGRPRALLGQRQPAHRRRAAASPLPRDGDQPGLRRRGRAALGAATSKQAVLDGDGRTFAEIAGERAS